MKQLLQHMKTGQAKVAEVPIPTPGEGMALIRTANSLVSAGTERMLVSFAKKGLLRKARSRPDLVREVLNKARREGLLTTIEAALNKLDQPFALGYSSSGTIIKTGPGLTGFKVGDRVACAGGGYAVHAEYAVIPQNLMVRIPDPVDFEQAAFATIGAIAIQGFRLSDTGVGARVGVIGLGLLGLLTTGIARAAGCQVLAVDLDPARVELAIQMGANKAVLRDQAEEAARSFTQGEGLDAILICADTSDNDPLTLAGEIARDRAKVVVVGSVGMDVPRKPYYEKELTLVVSRSYGPGRYDPGYEEKGLDYPIGYVRWTENRNIAAFLTLLGEGKLNIPALISHRVPIVDAVQAYAVITGEQPYLGVLITYDEHELPEERRIFNHEAPYVQVKPGDFVALGVLGAGNYALSTFLPTVKKVGGIAPVGIVSASGVSAHQAAHKFGFGFAASEEDTLLEDPSINLIAILTRHNLHSQQIQRALEAGKHVYCEKPLTINLEQLEQIEEMLQNEKLTLLTLGFNRRFAPLALHLKSFVDQRQEPLYMHYRVNANVIPKGHWLIDPEIGGGRIIGESCHFIDFLTYLVGEIPVEVKAEGLPDGGVYSEDNLVMTFRFPDQSLGVVSYLANGDKAYPKEELEVFFGGRVAALHDWRRLETVFKGRRKVRRHRLRQDKGHENAWRTFLTAIQGEGKPPIPYDQLLGVTRASFAALEALRTGDPVQILKK
jgi:predicted dehydrogenase